MKSSKEAIFRPNGAAESTNALMDTSQEKDKDGFPETITIHNPHIIKPGELRDRMVKQYRQQCERVFKARQIRGPNVSLDQVIEGLRTDKTALEGAVRMEFEGREPTLILPSGLKRAELVEVTNRNKAAGQIYDTYTYELGDDRLWGPDTEDTGVIIAEGISDVAQDPEILKIIENRAKAIKWAENLRERDLKPISGVQKWVMFSLLALSQGERIWSQTFDVLNADRLKELNKMALISYGRWRDIQLFLDGSDSDRSDWDLRVRASVEVDVSKV